MNEVAIFFVGAYFGGCLVSFCMGVYVREEEPWFFLFLVFCWPFSLALLFSDGLGD